MILHNRSDSERPDPQSENSSLVPTYSYVQVPVVRLATYCMFLNMMLLLPQCCLYLVKIVIIYVWGNEDIGIAAKTCICNVRRQLNC